MSPKRRVDRLPRGPIKSHAVVYEHHRKLLMQQTTEDHHIDVEDEEKPVILDTPIEGNEVERAESRLRAIREGLRRWKAGKKRQ